MSTALRRGVFESGDAAAAGRAGEAADASWAWAALAAIGVAAALALGVADAAAHPGVDRGAPEPPYVGWGD